MSANIRTAKLEPLRAAFGERLQKRASLARYAAARLGGPADWLLVANTADHLAEIVSKLWELEMPFLILGSGSNVLISDAGVRGLVVINRSKEMQFQADTEPPAVWVESGANFGVVARQAAALGLSGIEWAVGIPGTIGGAIIGNAGAHNGDMAGNLILAEILHHVEGRQRWTADRFQYGYRHSAIKGQSTAADQPKVVVLSALLKLGRSTPEAVQDKLQLFTVQRHRTQPPGASLGSMFKNPPGDYAGRLIEAAGLKGARIGDAEISPLHANFFINRGHATATDIYRLIQLAQKTVKDNFKLELELEVELVGDWETVRLKA